MFSYKKLAVRNTQTRSSPHNRESSEIGRSPRGLVFVNFSQVLRREQIAAGALARIGKRNSLTLSLPESEFVLPGGHDARWPDYEFRSFL